jgi:FMN phosphatase YigB (HAD superfamily)
MTENIVLFDLDGTLADYDKAMYHDLAALAGIDEPKYGIYQRAPPHIANRMSLIKEKPNWWLNLEKYQLGFDILEACVDIGFSIHILTQGPLTKPTAWKEKVEWFHEYVVPAAPDAKITITRDKSLVYGKVLVDDFPDYILRWLKHRPRGLGVMPANENNQDLTHPNVLRYDGSNLDAVVSKLEKAYQRIGGKE